MRALVYLLINLVILFAHANSFAASELKTTAGTEFIFSFSPNHSSAPELSLMISSEYETSGVVSIPRMKTNIFFEVTPGVVTRVTIPSQMANLPRGVKSDYGISVVAEEPITVYGLNRLLKHTDAFLILPKSALGMSYFAIGYHGSTSSQPSQAAIVAVHDNTTVEIVSPARTSSAQAGVKQTVTLNKMETFLLSAYSTSNDITGTRIVADKAVALTSGAKCSIIPKELNNGCDHLVEMLPPTDSWGKNFITYPLETRKKGDLIRILAGENDTDVMVNGRLIKTLQSGAYHDLMPSNQFNLIQTSKPSLVAQYSLTTLYDDVVGDPFMMLIPPIEQSLSSYTFATSDKNIEAHYINVIIRSTGIDNIQLDGVQIASTVFTPIGDGIYSAARIKIDPGSHTIKSSIPFSLYVYGFGDFESYGYPGGIATETINASTVDYRDVKVVSTLGRTDIELDANSFSTEPSSVYEENGAVKIEWNFEEFSIGQVKNLNYEVVARQLEPGESREITSSLEMFYKDLDGVEHRRLLGEQVIIIPESIQAIGVNLNETKYLSGETVAFDVEVKNLSELSEEVHVLVEIVDGGGNVVSTLMSGELIDVPALSTKLMEGITYNLDDIYQGDYKVVAAIVGKDGQRVSESIAEFSVVSDGLSSLMVSVTADKAQYNKNDLSELSVVISNTSSNSYLEDAKATLKVIDPNGDLFWEADITLGQLSALTADYSTHTVFLKSPTAGRYIASVELFDKDGHLIESDIAQFDLIVEIKDLTAQVNVSADKVEAGESLSCLVEVSNSSEIQRAANFKLSVFNIDNEEAIHTEEINLSLDEFEHLAFSRTLATADKEGNFACVLERIDSGELTALGVANFTIYQKEVTFNVSAEINVSDSSRVLILIDESVGYRDELENYLLANEWSYTLTVHQEDFLAELNSGAYGIYVIASQHVPLTHAIKQRLSEVVESGSGLLLIGSPNEDYSELEKLLGVNIATPKSIDGTVTLASEMVSNSLVFKSPLAIIDFAPSSAEIIAKYKVDNAGDSLFDPSNIFAEASPYNCLVFEDFLSLSSSIDGRLAVGGNLTLGNYSVGEALNTQPIGDVVTVDGDVVFQSGKIANGNLIASGGVDGVSQSVKLGMAPGSFIKGNASLPIDFVKTRDRLERLTVQIDKLPTNGRLINQYGAVTLTGDCASDLQVFEISSEELQSTHTLSHQCIPTNATVVLNVKGRHVVIQSMGMQSLGGIRDRVLFNFANTETLTIKYVGIEGSILAPFASVTQPAGRISGQIIAKSWLSTDYGYLSIHNEPFSGKVELVQEEIKGNAISVNQAGFGKSIFSGLDLLSLLASPSSNESDSVMSLVGDLVRHVDPLLGSPSRVIPINVVYQNHGDNSFYGRLKLKVPDGIKVLHGGDFILDSVTGAWTASTQLDPQTEAGSVIYVTREAPGMGTIGLVVDAEQKGAWIKVAETTFELR